MLKYKTTKYFYTCLLFGFCCLVLYVCIILNSCILGGLKRILRNPGKESVSPFIKDPSGFHYVRKGDNMQTIVRVVPLTWQKELDETENDTELIPKYHFLRQRELIPSRKLPDALIIGVKKGGTRALLEFVRLHPDVRAAGSEVHFFDKFYKKGLLWYQHHMPPTLEGQLTMEKTPSYFITKEVPERIYNMNPATKLIVVVRDPVTRAISDYAQAASKKRDMKKFEELAFLNGTDGLVDTSWAPVKIGVYARYLERWLRYFPLNQFLFVSGERLIVDPAKEMLRLQDFLGLKRIVTEKHFYFNATKGFPCLLKSVSSSSPHCLGKTKGRNHPRIDPYAL